MNRILQKVSLSPRRISAAALIKRNAIKGVLSVLLLVSFAVSVSAVMVSRDSTQALPDKEALYHVAMMSLAGEGNFDKDAVKACGYFQQAAQAGHVESQYVLGSLYSRGEGCVQDYALAYFWLNLASRGAREGAFAAGEDAAEMLSDEEVEDVRRKADQWLQCHRTHQNCAVKYPRRVKQGTQTASLRGYGII